MHFFIIRAYFSIASAGQVPQLIDQLIGDLNYRLENATTEEQLLKAVLETHIQFEKIHPFSDGNGRTGRMIMNYSLLENGLPPLIIRKQNKKEYIQILAEAQVKGFPDEKDIVGFLAFARPIIEEERRRMSSFANKESKQV